MTRVNQAAKDHKESPVAPAQKAKKVAEETRENVVKRAIEESPDVPDLEVPQDPVAL